MQDPIYDVGGDAPASLEDLLGERKPRGPGVTPMAREAEDLAQRHRQLVEQLAGTRDPHQPDTVRQRQTQDEGLNRRARRQRDRGKPTRGRGVTR